MLAGDGGLRPVQIQVGPSDGKSTAVLGGELSERDRVVTGLAGAANGQGAPGKNGRPRFGRFL